MEPFCVNGRVENPAQRQRGADADLLVDPGSEYTWISAQMLEVAGIAAEKRIALQAGGRELVRAVGFAVVRLAGRLTVDEIVFAEEGDVQVVGARTLDGLRLDIDPWARRLVPTGSAAASRARRRDPAHAGGSRRG